MKIPKRTAKAIKTLETMLEYLHYYMGDCKEFRNFIANEIKDLEEYLQELSLDNKVKNIKLAQKIKNKWKETNPNESNKK